MNAVQTSFDCSDLENPIGERSKDALRVNLDPKLNLEFHGTKVTGDAERLSVDLAMCEVVGERVAELQAVVVRGKFDIILESKGLVV
jgi:hypothetical protein